MLTNGITYKSSWWFCYVIDVSINWILIYPDVCIVFVLTIILTDWMLVGVCHEIISKLLIKVLNNFASDLNDI